jgi:DNA-binding transcriptional regulator GbsR (MarR family)
MVSDKDKILSTFKECFDECLEEEISEIENRIEDSAETSLKHETDDEQLPRTVEDVEKAIKRLNSNKTVGRTIYLVNYLITEGMNY